MAVNVCPRAMTLRTGSTPAASLDCCPDGLVGPLSRDAAEGIARTLEAVADATRLQLLALIKASPDGKACACDLTEPLGLTQLTVSHHLKILAEMGLPHRKRHGVWVRYSLDQDALDALAALPRSRGPGSSGSVMVSMRLRSPHDLVEQAAAHPLGRCPRASAAAARGSKRAAPSSPPRPWTARSPAGA